MENTTKFTLQRHIRKNHTNIQSDLVNDCKSYVLGGNTVTSKENLILQVNRLTEQANNQENQIKKLKKNLLVLQRNANARAQAVDSLPVMVSDSHSQIIAKKTYEK